MFSLGIRCLVWGSGEGDWYMVGQEGERYGVVGRVMRYTFIHQSGDRVDGGSTITGYILDIVDSGIVHLLLLYIHIMWCVVCRRHNRQLQKKNSRKIKGTKIKIKREQKIYKNHNMQGKTADHISLPISSSQFQTISPFLCLSEYLGLIRVLGAICSLWQPINMACLPNKHTHSLLSTYAQGNFKASGKPHTLSS